MVQEEISFKRFLIWSSGGPLVQWSQAICAERVSWGTEGIMGNIHVKLCLKKKFTDGGWMMDGQRDDRQRLITIAHLEPLVHVG